MISKVIETQPIDTQNTAKPPRVTQRPTSKRQVWLGWLGWLVFWSAVGIGGYFAWPTVYPKFVAWQAARTAKPAPPPARIVPVIAAAARQADMEIYLTGLGTVTAFNTVTIRSRVDGELIKVAFSEGQMVREGQLLAKIDPRQYQVQLAQAQGTLARDRAILKNAELDLERYTGLAKTKSISAQQVDLQQALVDQNEGVVKSDLAAIESAKLMLSYCQITAPISGRIGLRTVDQGNMVRASDPGGLAVITQLQPISVVFTIPQDDIARVQKQSPDGKPLPVEAFDRDFKTLLATGTLSAVDNQVDPTTGTLRLKATFKNENDTLFPNQFVNARLLVDRLHDATVIPAAAIQRGPTSTFVYVVRSDETVELRPVVLGPTEGDLTAITSGLAVGDLIVTDGLDKLQPDSKIALRRENTPAGGDAQRAVAAKPKAEASEQPAASGDGPISSQDDRVDRGRPEIGHEATPDDEAAIDGQASETSGGRSPAIKQFVPRSKNSSHNRVSAESALDHDSVADPESDAPAGPVRNKATK